MRKEDLPPKYQRQVEQKLGVQTAKNAVKTNKYNAVKETVGKLKFDSKKERQRFEELMLMERAGEIKGLKLQHDFTLQEAFTTTDGERVRAIRYRADFTYYDSAGNWIIEDAKGMKTDIYKLKKKMMAQKGYRIIET